MKSLFVNLAILGVEEVPITNPTIELLLHSLTSSNVIVQIRALGQIILAHVTLDVIVNQVLVVVLHVQVEGLSRDRQLLAKLALVALVLGVLLGNVTQKLLPNVENNLTSMTLGLEGFFGNPAVSEPADPESWCISSSQGSVALSTVLLKKRLTRVKFSTFITFQVISIVRMRQLFVPSLSSGGCKSFVTHVTIVRSLASLHVLFKASFGGVGLLTCLALHKLLAVLDLHMMHQIRVAGVGETVVTNVAKVFLGIGLDVRILLVNLGLFMDSSNVLHQSGLLGEHLGANMALDSFVVVNDFDVSVVAFLG